MVSFKNVFLMAIVATFALCTVQVQAAPTAAGSDELTNADIVKILDDAYGKKLDQSKVVAAIRKNYLCRSNCYVEALKEKRKTAGLLTSQSKFNAQMTSEISRVDACAQNIINSLQSYKDVTDYIAKTRIWQLTVAQYCADKDSIAQTGVIDFVPVHTYAAYCDISVKQCGATYNEEMKQIEASASPSS